MGGGYSVHVNAVFERQEKNVDQTIIVIEHADTALHMSQSARFEYLTVTAGVARYAVSRRRKAGVAATTQTRRS